MTFDLEKAARMGAQDGAAALSREEAAERAALAKMAEAEREAKALEVENKTNALDGFKKIAAVLLGTAAWADLKEFRLSVQEMPSVEPEDRRFPPLLVLSINHCSMAEVGYVAYMCSQKHIGLSVVPGEGVFKLLSRTEYNLPSRAGFQCCRQKTLDVLSGFADYQIIEGPFAPANQEAIVKAIYSLATERKWIAPRAAAKNDAASPA